LTATIDGLDEMLYHNPSIVPAKFYDTLAMVLQVSVSFEQEE